ncbi:alpha/beta hydrolase, partial [Streptomyces sp. SR27]|nr:alpha/beta hydrolase [Streptomyces sp. SR27]
MPPPATNPAAPERDGRPMTLCRTRRADPDTLLVRSAPAEAAAPAAAVLLLHGGRADGPEPPPALN